jgi:DNA-binding LacI/PurR family transcriptional regulator
MRSPDKIFKYTFFITFIIVVFSFVITFYVQSESMGNMENFLSSASVAGFIAIFSQFSTTLVQEYFKRKTYKVCMLCKKSHFSLSIAAAVREYYSKEIDVVLHVELIEPGDNAEDDLIFFLSKGAFEYDGLIIRPLNNSEEFSAKINILLNRGKKVILTDLNLTKKQLETMNTKELPFYIGSDFKEGGLLLAGYIKELVFASTKYTEVILFLGPSNTASARKRGKELIWQLSVNNITVTSILELNSFNAEDSLKLFDKSCALKNKTSNNNLIIFCANDDIATKLIEINYFSNNPYPAIKEKFQSSNDLVFLGYDGIKNNNEEYVLSQYKVNYATVDVNPAKQGEVSAKVMMEKLNSNIKSYSTEELVQPSLIINNKRA